MKQKMNNKTLITINNNQTLLTIMTYVRHQSVKLHDCEQRISFANVLFLKLLFSFESVMLPSVINIKICSFKLP